MDENKELQNQEAPQRKGLKRLNPNYKTKEEKAAERAALSEMETDHSVSSLCSS